MQPHEVKDSRSVALQSNHIAAALVKAWRGSAMGRDDTSVGERCNLVNEKYPNLEQVIKEAITFTKGDALKRKGKKGNEALNFGYLDRLFILNNNKVTKIERDLEVQAMLYGGDHLPQLFHVIATSRPDQVGGDRPAYDEKKKNPITISNYTIVHNNTRIRNRIKKRTKNQSGTRK